MECIAIVAAGELGATLARLLAEGEVSRRVVLADPDEGMLIAEVVIPFASRDLLKGLS